MFTQLTFGFPASQALPAAPDWIEALLCQHRSCDEIATDSIPWGKHRPNVCAIHAREYRRSYGDADITPIGFNGPTNFHWSTR